MPKTKFTFEDLIAAYQEAMAWQPPAPAQGMDALSKVLSSAQSIDTEPGPMPRQARRPNPYGVMNGPQN